MYRKRARGTKGKAQRDRQKWRKKGREGWRKGKFKRQSQTDKERERV